MKVYSQLISAQLENKTSDYTATVVGRIWWNSTSAKVMSTDGSLVRAFLKNDQKCIFGNSGTASQNTRFNRSAVNALQLCTGDDTTAEGSTSTSAAQIDARMVNYTTAGRPAASASNVGRLIYDTTLANLVFDNGGTWTQVASGSTTSRVNAVWDFVVGSSAQVTSGAATHSSIASAITAASAGDSIFILKGTYTENITVSKKLAITGSGGGSVINGTVTFNSSSDNSYMTGIRATGDVTLDSGADGIIVDDIFLASGKTFVDNGSGNYLMAVQE